MDELLEPLQLTALPPLSPTMERAFSEAFADMSELQDAAVVKLESSGASSPSAASMASAAHNQHKHEREIRSMSPSGNTVEDKRARRSAIEKKSRQRRQGILKRMRNEVKQLEDLYTEIEQQKEVGGSVKVDELQHKYSELSLMTYALEVDREALQKLLQQQEEFQKLVTSLSVQKNKIWDTGVPPSSSFQATFTKLSTTECYALVRESYEEIQRFNDAENFETTGANFMGWTDKRRYDSRSGALFYGFTKQFPLEMPEDLLLKTWEIFSDGPKFKDMSFDRSVNTRYEVLQALNDDLLIVRRDHRIPNIETTFVSIQIMFRLQTPTGYTLCMRTIPAPEIQDLQDPHEYFYEVFHWTHFNRLYDEDGKPAGCEIVAAGSIADQNHLKSTYWLFELVCSILRWETSCVAPLFLKQI